MKYDSGKFESGYRLANIHRVKRYLFIVEAVIILVFAAYLLVANNSFEFIPFFLGINSFLYFVLLMFLVILLESFVFIILEIRFVKSTSTKFLITQRAVRTSVIGVVVSLLVIVLLWAPILPDLVENQMQGGDRLVVGSSTEPSIRTMYNRDPLGLTEVKTVEFKASSVIDVFIVPEESYDRFKDDGKDVLGAYRVNADYQIDSDTVLSFPEADHDRFYILIYSEFNGSVNVDYTITSEISQSVMTYLPFMALFFLIAYGCWGGYMYIENKRNVQGIYR